MCECIESVEKMLEDKLFEQNPGAIITESVKLESQALMFNTGSIALYSPANGKFEVGGRKKKFDVNMYFTFCPFCGERYEKLNDDSMAVAL